jgi:hypothetical protein
MAKWVAPGKFEISFDHDFTPEEAQTFMNAWNNKGPLDDVEWHYGEKGPAALRKYALEKATTLAYGQLATADMVVDAAIKIEAYLRGELGGPNDL